MNLNRKLLLNRYLRKAEACTSLRSLLPASFPMNMITTKKNIHTMISACAAPVSAPSILLNPFITGIFAMISDDFTTTHIASDNAAYIATNEPALMMSFAR